MSCYDPSDWKYDRRKLTTTGGGKDDVGPLIGDVTGFADDGIGGPGGKSVGVELAIGGGLAGGNIPGPGVC